MTFMTNEELHEERLAEAQLEEWHDQAAIETEELDEPHPAERWNDEDWHK